MLDQVLTYFEGGSGTSLAAPGIMRSHCLKWIAVVGVAIVLMIAGLDSHTVVQSPYRIETSGANLANLKRRFTPTQIELLEKLNRADAEHLGRLNELVVPESWPLDERLTTTLPRSYGPARPYPKLLVVHVPGQIFGAYESGELVRWGPVSTGARETQTSAGWFHLTWRAVGHVSTVNPDWYMKWYFNFGNESGLAFHEYALPGYPASHGCVRLLGRDAQWLFEWGEPWTLDRTGQRMIGEGTPVLITGFYDFESPPPWHSPAWLTSPIDLPPVLPQSAGEGPREAVGLHATISPCGDHAQSDGTLGIRLAEHPRSHAFSGLGVEAAAKNSPSC
jgi:hypothetical protein